MSINKNLYDIIDILASFIKADKLYKEYNKKYFDNKLPSDIVIKTFNHPYATGAWKESTKVIKLSKDLTHKKLIEILLHEMSHVAVYFINKKTFKTNLASHGKDWQFWMRKCKQKIGDAYMKPKKLLTIFYFGSIAYCLDDGNWKKVIVLKKKKNTNLFYCYVPHLKEAQYIPKYELYGKDKVILKNKSLWTEIKSQLSSERLLNQIEYFDINKPQILANNKDIDDLPTGKKSKDWVDFLILKTKMFKKGIFID